MYCRVALCRVVKVNLWHRVGTSGEHPTGRTGLEEKETCWPLLCSVVECVFIRTGQRGCRTRNTQVGLPSLRRRSGSTNRNPIIGVLAPAILLLALLMCAESDFLECALLLIFAAAMVYARWVNARRAVRGMLKQLRHQLICISQIVYDN